MNQQMPSSRDVRSVLPRQFRRLPADLTLVLAFVVATNVAVLVPMVRTTPLRAVFGFAFVLFVPGYALTAAVFPRRRPDSETVAPESSSGGDRDDVRRIRITGIERFVFSMGASVVVAPLAALALNFTPWGIDLLPALVSLSAFTVVMTVAAAVRRQALPTGERFRVPFRRWFRNAGTGQYSPNSRSDVIFGIALVLALVLAASSATYAVTTPDQSDPHSEFYLLTENDAGDLVADGYPQNLTTDSSEPIVVGVNNRENRPQRYTVVVELQETTSEGNEARVTGAETLERFETDRLETDETWQQTHQLTPTMTGDSLRLTYKLFTGDPPQDPTTGDAYRELNLWVNVTAGSTGG